MPPAINRRGQLQAASALGTLNDKELLPGSPASSLETQIRHFRSSGLGCRSRPLIPISGGVISVKFKWHWHSNGESQTTWENNQREARCHTSQPTRSNFKDLSALSGRIIYRAPLWFLTSSLSNQTSPWNNARILKETWRPGTYLTPGTEKHVGLTMSCGQVHCFSFVISRVPTGPVVKHTAAQTQADLFPTEKCSLSYYL